MARGGRRRRRGGRPQKSTSAAPAEPSPSSSDRRTSREVAIVKKDAEKNSDPSGTATSSSVPQASWADLPSDLLNSIVLLLRSPHETLAFAATCRPWYAAVFSPCLSAPNLFTLFPPVLLRLKVVPSEFFVHVTNTDASPLRCRLPWRTVDKMDYLGCSYGNIIYCYKKSFYLFDAFTGARKKCPWLFHEYPPIMCALTAPLASPDSALLVTVGRSLFHWKVGSAYWLKLSQNHIDVRIHQYISPWSQLHQPIVQVTSFKGEIFAIDSCMDLFRVFLEPGFRLQELRVLSRAADRFFGNPWFVVCGDMLLLVGPAKDGRSYQALRLDLSSRRKWWVKVERLENWAVFIGRGARNQAFACKNPERWGGRSNCVYLCGVGKPWRVLQLGEVAKDPDPSNAHLPDNQRYILHDEVAANLSSVWVFPGVVSRIRQ